MPVQSDFGHSRKWIGNLSCNHHHGGFQSDFKRAFNVPKWPRSYVMWLPLPGVALVATGLIGFRKRRVVRMLLCALLCGLIFVQVRCGGDTPLGSGTAGTPPGAYSITITGTSGAQRSTTLTLTVRQRP